jgi:hypothetical protein
MRIAALSLFLSLAIIGCSSSTNDPVEVFVDELSLAEQEDLCEAFLDDFCNTPGNETFCDDPCIDTGCGPVAQNGGFDIECADVTDLEVLDCGASGQEIDCSGGPGCIADALVGECGI